MFADLAIIDNTVEKAARQEVLEGGSGRAVVQQEFGGQQHQGFLVGSVHLAAQCVKQLGRCGCIDYKQVGVTLCIPPHKLHHELVPVTLQKQHVLSASQIFMYECTLCKGLIS